MLLNANVPVVRQLDPFNPTSRKVGRAATGQTLQQVFDEYGPIIPEYQDLVLFLNGRPVLRAGWDYQLAANDHVYIKPFPQGGDGGGGMRMGAQLAVAAAAMYVGGPAGAAIMIGGNLAINAFMPLPEPPAPQQIQPFSNTYQSQSRGNVAKAMQPIPWQAGELEFYPDEGANSYFAYEDNKQIYYQLLVLGQNSFLAKTDTIKLGGNDFDLIENKQFEVVQPGEALTLVNPTVTPVKINQIEIEDSSLFNGWKLVGASDDYGRNMIHISGSSSHTFRAGALSHPWFPAENHNWLDVDIGDKVKFIDHSNNQSEIVTVSQIERDGNQNLKTFTIDAANYSLIETFLNNCLDYYDGPTGESQPYHKCHVIVWDEATNDQKYQYTDVFTIDSNDDISSIEFDVVVPKGGQGSVDVIVHIRGVDNDNNPISDWDSKVVTIAKSSTDDTYSTHTEAVMPGRYQIRFSRLDYKVDFQDVIYLTGVKGIGSTAPNSTISEGCTLLAIKVEVPESQNITLGETRIVATARNPVLVNNSGNYSWTSGDASQSIVAAIGGAMKNKYGDNFSDYLMPLDELYTLHQIWESRGDKFNGRFDQQVTDKEAMQLIARAGRAIALEIGDKWHFIRDQPGVPTYPYSIGNILSNENSAEPFYSVSHKRPLPSDSDGIIVEFFNERYWEWDETPSYPTDASNPKRIRFFGVTNKEQAWRECCYLYATEIVKPSTVTWRTELEALNHSYGDLVTIAPPKSNVYGAGYLVSINGNTFELSEPMPWESGYHFLTFRRDDGTLSGPYEVSRGVTDYHCVLKAGQTLDFTPHTGILNGVQREPTQCQFGKSGTGKTVRFLGRKQVGDHAFELTGTVEHDFKHTIDSTPLPT